MRKVRTYGRKQKAFTLVETIIILAMMTVFIGTLFSAMHAGLRYWRDGRLRLRAQNALRESLDAITIELRQAIPDPDPGTDGNPPTGYIAVDPDIDPTGLLYPNVHNIEGDYLEFTEPVETSFIPSQTGWSEEQPDNYQKIRYFIENGILKRRVTLFTANGVIQSETENNLVSLQGGELSMKAKYISPTFLEIEMTAQISKETEVKYRFSYTIKTKVKIGT